MFEQTFKNIDDILYKDAGADSELDYIEQTSWILFLRYLDMLEIQKKEEAELDGENYEFIIDEKYRWTSWARPLNKKGEVDKNKRLTGKDLVEFVDQELFPYLGKLKEKDTNPNSLIHKIGEIFQELDNKIRSGYNLADIIDLADSLQFQTSTEQHELSQLYETKIKNMGNAGRNGGQYYTPRPLIRAMINVIDPKIGETIYDGACGSAGFLCESYDYLLSKMEQTTTNMETLRTKTLYGVEKKDLAYVIGIMNMVLHGIEEPNILKANTLAEPLKNITEKDRHDIILANPPFGGKERKEVQENFDIKTSETAFLFLQHFIRKLRAGGRAAIVIKNTFLSNTDNASVSLRKELLENCNLHTILDMPAGTFLGAGVKTVVLFFDKGEATKKIWYYQLDPGRNMGKTNPLNDDDMAEFVKLQKKEPETEKSWVMDVSQIADDKSYDLSAKNPNKAEEAPLRSPKEIIKEMAKLDKETNKVIESISELL